MGRKPDPTVRTEILQQAEHLIHLRGFSATTMDEIARHCGMTKANLFHHFGSKEELGLAVLDWKLADLRARRVEPLCTQCDPLKVVEELFQSAEAHYKGIGCKAGCFVANIAIETSDANEQFRRRTDEYFKAWISRMADCIERAQTAGVFSDALDAKGAAESVISLYEGAILLARTSRDATVFRRVGKIARSILEHHQSRANGAKNRREATMGPKTPCGC